MIPFFFEDFSSKLFCSKFGFVPLSLVDAVLFEERFEKRLFIFERKVFPLFIKMLLEFSELFIKEEFITEIEDKDKILFIISFKFEGKFGLI